MSVLLSGRARAPLALVAAAACWGVGTVLTKQVVDDLAPLTLLPVQLAASCAVLAVAGLVQGARVSWTPGMRRLALLGVLNPGVAYALGLIGLTTISASLSVLLWAAEPVLIAVAAWALLGDRIASAVAALLAAAVAGVLLVVYQPGASGSVVGITLTLAAVTCCALYTVLTRQLLLDDASLPVVLVQQLAALAFALVLATGVWVAGGPGWVTAAISPAQWGFAALSGIVYYGLAFWFYLDGLRRLPATVAGGFLPLIPVFGVAAGYLAGDRLEGRQWWGAAIVVAATLALAAYSRSAERATVATARP